MRTLSLDLPGIVLIEHQAFDDARGAFYESWNERDFAAAGALLCWSALPCSIVKLVLSQSTAAEITGLSRPTNGRVESANRG